MKVTIENEEQFLKLYDEGHNFTEDELKCVRWTFPVEDEVEGKPHRWVTPITSIFDMKDKE